MLKPVLGGQIQLGHPLANGLVGCWLMNEGSGSKVADLSGNGNMGTFGATPPVWKAGKFGSCLSFTAATTYNEVIIPDSPAWDFSTSFTLSAWIKFDAKVIEGKYGGIITRVATYPYPWGLRIYATGAYHYLEVGIDADSFQYVWNDPVIGKWYYVVGLWDGIYRRLYIDATEVANEEFTSPPTASANPVRIGMDYNGSQDRSFPGQIEIPTIYNRALSAQEIRQLYMTPFCMFEREAIELFSAMTPAAEALEVYVWDTTAA